MALRGLRQHLVLQCTFGLVLSLAGNANAQPDKPIDPTRITEAPCPHRDKEVLKLNRGQVSIPAPNSWQIGQTAKSNPIMSLKFDSVRLRNDSGAKPRLPDRALLYLDCASQDTPPQDKQVLWDYRAVLQIPEPEGAFPTSHFKVGSVEVNIMGDRSVLDQLEPYNGMEVVLRLIEEPEGVNLLMLRSTVLKVILQPQK
jgi:hypothetical protein